MNPQNPLDLMHQRIQKELWEEEDKKILKNLKQASKLSVSRGNAVRGLIFALPVGLFLWFLIIWSILTMIGWIKTCL